MEDYESDGSASPELGVDDVVVPHTPTPSVKSKPPTPQKNVLSPAKPTAPPSQKIPHRSTIPVPPLLPQKREKLNKSPHRTSLHVVLQEDVKPLLKREEDKPAERFRFKPQVPRPTPVSPFKSVTPKQECPIEHNLVGNDVNSGEVKSLTNKKDRVRICDKPPPIRLKLKLDGKEVYIENNENSEKGHEKKQKKHKKKKKEGHKRRSEDFKHVKDQQRPQELRKSDVKKTMNDASPQEVVAVTSNGIRMKLKFGLGANIMNSITRSVSTKESEEPKLVHKVFDSQPSTSRASSLVSPQQPRIPRLKIRIGHDAPPLVIAPVSGSPSVTSNAQPVNVTSLSTLMSGSKSTQVLSTTQVSAEPLAVEFSDDSDTEAERLRCATDEALRGMSSFSGLTRTNSSVLPWSTQGAP